MVLNGDIGPQVIDFLHRSLNIDEEWCVREPRGFTWWGHRLAQHIWADRPRIERGVEFVRVNAETNVLRGVREESNTVGIISSLNAHAALNAFVWNPWEARLSYRSSAYFHQGNFEWLQRLLLAAVGMQVADAHIKVDTLAGLLGGTPDESIHPISGRRDEMDDILNVIESLVVPRGEGPSPFTEEDLRTAAEIEPSPWALVNHDEAGMTAEIPFYNDRPAILAILEKDRPVGELGTALLEVLTDERHPQLGSGAMLLLRLPIELQPDQALRIAHELNSAESTHWTFSHFFGGWCRDIQLSNTVSFVSFIPAAVYKPGLLANMVLNMAVRVRAVKEYLDS